MVIKAIGFDLDDTLYDRSEYYKKIFNIMSQSIVDIDVDFKEFYHWFQFFSDLEYEKFIQGKKSKKDYQIDRVIETYRHFDTLISREDAIIFDALYLYYREELVYREYAENLLARLKEEGFYLFILTNGASEDQRNKLRKLSISKYIPEERWFVSDELGTTKPESEIFKIVEEKIQFSCKDILYIGDNYSNDIEGANNVGWRTLFLNIHNETEIKVETTLIDSMKDVLDQIMLM